MALRDVIAEPHSPPKHIADIPSLLYRVDDVSMLSTTASPTSISPHFRRPQNISGVIPRFCPTPRCS